MRNLENMLKNKAIECNKLVEYGFKKQENKYIFKNKIYNKQFEIVVIISDKQKTSKLIDLANDEEYIMVDIQDCAGKFVGEIRQEYEKTIQDIINKCTIDEIYKNQQSKEVIKYIKEKYDDDLEFLWKKYDNNAIWRNKQNNKWYGVLLVISSKKLGLDYDKEIEILDLRYQKDEIDKIIDNKKIYPGYHMNKKSNMTLNEFKDFYYNVCNVDYNKMKIAMEPLKELMNKTDKVHIVAPETDLTFSIKGIPAKKYYGTFNIPDGEVATCPVKNSVNGYQCVIHCLMKK